MINVKVVGVASPSDVSPNTPKADEANYSIYGSIMIFLSKD